MKFVGRELYDQRNPNPILENCDRAVAQQNWGSQCSFGRAQPARACVGPGRAWSPSPAAYVSKEKNGKGGALPSDSPGPLEVRVGHQQRIFFTPSCVFPVVFQNRSGLEIYVWFMSFPFPMGRTYCGELVPILLLWVVWVQGRFLFGPNAFSRSSNSRISYEKSVCHSEMPDLTLTQWHDWISVLSFGKRVSVSYTENVCWTVCCV